jgi:hypothetical protein
MLDDKKLFDIITLEELEKTIIGEEKARRAIFLSLCSIWTVGAQVHTLVNSESSAGKSYICSKIRNLFAPEMFEWRTRTTPAVFTYWHNAKYEPEWSWDGKFCYLEDTSEQIINSDVFKVMCSEGSKATVVIKQRAYDIIIQGKPTMLLTTANAFPSLEVMNRFNLITLNETETQTIAVKERQAQYAMMWDGEKEHPTQEIFKLLKRVRVSVPFANKLPRYFPNEVRARRDFPRFLDLIKASASLHQMQRQTNEKGVVAAEGRDYELAREAMTYIFQGVPVGLNRRQAMAWETCRNLYDAKLLETVDKTEEELKGSTAPGFTAKEAWIENPMVGEESWRKMLDAIARRGLLTLHLSEPEGKGRPSVLYSTNTNNDVNLPSFEDI